MLPRRIVLFLLTYYFCSRSMASTAEKKNSKPKGNLMSFLNYDIHHSDRLPSDKQISSYLTKGETKTFSYVSQIQNAPLSITIITCTSSLDLIIKFGQNSTMKQQHVSNLTIENIKTLYITTKIGLYTLELTAIDQSTYLHIYVSTEPNGPQALQSTQIQNVLKLLKRQQRRKLTVRWEPSLVDPHVTEYCLVTSRKKHYLTLCSAHGEKFGVIPPFNQTQTGVVFQSAKLKSRDQKNGKPKDPTITCVGEKTYLTLSNLQQNQNYYLDLFALNRQSGLTYIYGTTSMVFDKRVKPINLKDNKSIFVNLKKLDGKAVLKFKLRKLLSDSLKLYVMPCGGAIDIDIILKNNVTLSRRKIEGFERLLIPNPQVGSRYYIKILSSTKEELRRTSGLEVLITTKSSSKTVLPDVPSERSVQEYVSSRKCDSVTVGWLTSPGQQVVRYCLIVREGHLREMDTFKMPNQCGLENRLKKSADFAVKHCRDVQLENEQVLTQKIKQLKPGKSYVVQVTVKKPKGKTLSYDLLQVNTKPICSNKSSKMTT